MATTSKSKSTRSTKKPAKAKKPATVKTSKKSASVKDNSASAAITTKTTVKGSLSPLERLRSFHVSSTLVYLVFAGIVLGFVSTNAAAVKLGIQARDDFAAGPSTVLAPASEVLFNIEPKYMLAAALLTGAIFSLLAATKLRGRYEATLTNRTSGLRWLALGISAAFLLTFVSLLAGVHDVAALKLSAFMIILTTMLSFMSERENAGSPRTKWFAFNLSLITGALAWLPVLGSLLGTSLYGMERFGWHVYALVAVTLLGFTGFAIHQYRNLRARDQKDYLSIEEKYLRIDLLTKFAVVIIVILAFK